MSDDYPQNLKLEAAGLAIGVVRAQFNADMVAVLSGRVVSVLEAAGAQVRTATVPGSWELPYAASRLAAAGDLDAVVVLGVVIAGDTQHHEHIAYATSYGIQKVALESGVPVINGILVTETREQAEARTTGPVDKGYHFAQAAVEMAHFKQSQLDRHG